VCKRDAQQIQLLVARKTRSLTFSSIAPSYTHATHRYPRINTIILQSSIHPQPVPKRRATNTIVSGRNIRSCLLIFYRSSKLYPSHTPALSPYQYTNIHHPTLESTKKTPFNHRQPPSIINQQSTQTINHQPPTTKHRRKRENEKERANSTHAEQAHNTRCSVVEAERRNGWKGELPIHNFACRRRRVTKSGMLFFLLRSPRASQLPLDESFGCCMFLSSQLHCFFPD
jgi:hypothetical protein